VAAEAPLPAPPTRVRPPLVEILLWALVTLVCVAGTSAMLILPTESKTVGLVYGGF
jgi:hypothetical protein